MTKIYECKTCGVIGEKSADLCHPHNTAISCRFFEDVHDYDPMVLCTPIMQHNTFSCDACGRISKDANLLCSPSQF